MIEIKIGDCTQRLKEIEDNSVDAVLCDPPYGLKFMSKGWDDIGDGSQQREWHRAWLKEAHRVLKPNGVLKAFSGSRTFHHLIAMMEEIGFSDLRIEAWAYGSGFPKSHNVAIGIDKFKGVESEFTGFTRAAPTTCFDGFATKRSRTKSSSLMSGKKKIASCKESIRYEGFGTALKPAWESICIGVKK